MSAPFALRMPISLSKKRQRRTAEPATLEADACAVAGGHARAAELEVLDHHVATHDEHGLAFGVLPVGVEHGAGAQAADGQAGQGDDADVAGIGAGLQRDGVSGDGLAQPLCQRAERHLRAHAQWLATGETAPIAGLAKPG